MEFVSPRILLLLLLSTLISANLLLMSVANPSSFSFSSSTFQEKQLRNILDALLSGGDFANWANFLSSSTKPLKLPLSATLFIPSNAAFSPVTAAGLAVDPFLVAYHIVPQHLTFAHLQRLPLHSRIPTLLATNSIIVTNNSRTNFSVDDAVVTHPDMFSSSGFSVHGVSKVLDYKMHGNGNATFDQGDEDVDVDVAVAVGSGDQGVDGGIGVVASPPAPAQRRPRAPMAPNDSLLEGADLPENSTVLEKPTTTDSVDSVDSAVSAAASSSSSFHLFLLSLVLGFVR